MQLFPEVKGEILRGRCGDDNDIPDPVRVFRPYPPGAAFAVYESEKNMEKRLAVVSIIVEDPDSVEKVNSLLHEYRDYVIGRMGIPVREKHVSLISVAMDAPQDRIAALSGKIGALAGISVKTAYSNVITKEEE